MKTVKTEMTSYWTRMGGLVIEAHTLYQLTSQVLNPKLSSKELKEVIHIDNKPKVHDASLQLVELLRREGVNAQIAFDRRKDGAIHKAVLNNVPKLKVVRNWAKKWKVQLPPTSIDNPKYK
jgi:hypothetical protein